MNWNNVIEWHTVFFFKSKSRLISRRNFRFKAVFILFPLVIESAWVEMFLYQIAFVCCVNFLVMISGVIWRFAWNTSLSSCLPQQQHSVHVKQQQKKNWITKFGTHKRIEYHIKAEMILLRLTPIFELSSNEIRFLENRWNCSLINNKSGEIIIHTTRRSIPL